MSVANFRKDAGLSPVFPEQMCLSRYQAKRVSTAKLFHKNSQTTDAAKGNDFRSKVVPVMSKTSAERQVYSKVLHVFRTLP